MYTCFVILLNLLKKKKVNVEMTIGKVATKNLDNADFFNYPGLLTNQLNISTSFLSLKKVKF